MPATRGRWRESFLALSCVCHLHNVNDKRMLSVMSDLAVIPSADLATLDPSLVARAADLATTPRSDATARAYAGDWARFESWCASHGLDALPTVESTVCVYLAHLAAEGLRYSTIARAYAAVRSKHADAGFRLGTLPAVTNTLRNLARELGTAARGKAPMMASTLKRVVRGSGDSTLAVRDRALLLVGFAGGFRRSELVALDVDDVRKVDDGLEVNVRFSKTDQGGQGRLVAIPFGSKGSCPVRALQDWLDRAGIVEGPVFRGVDRGGKVSEERLSDQGVARAVRRAAEQAGLDAKNFAGHSLRSGLVTSAAKHGASLDAIMRTTGHRSEAIARRYIKHASLFDQCAADGLL